MNSIRRRLSLTLALVLLAAGVLLAFALRDFPRRMVEEHVLARLDHDADLLYVHLLDALARQEGEAALETSLLAAAGPGYDLPLSGHYFVVRLGERQWRSRSTWDADLDLLAGREDGVSPRLAGPAGQALLVLAKRFPDSTDGRAVSIALAEDVAAIDAAIAAFRVQALTVLGLALLVLLVLQRRVLVRGLAPLDEAVEACRRLERGEAVQFEADAPAEVRPLLAAVERLSRHQAQRLGRIRHAAGNLSHALKTPLAVLGQSADALAARGDAEGADAIRAQLETMRATIERELRRARLAGGGAGGAGFALRAQLGAIVEVLQRLHAGRGLRIELEADERTWPVDREDMLELFGNLLDNACKWARARVRVVVVPDAETARLAFSVEDDGPGVPPELLDRLGTAGLRADESRPGHGIGLAIVGDIVAQYGGTIRFGRGSALGGLRVDVELPLLG